MIAKRIFILACLLTYFISIISAQNQANTWYFRQGNGLDFNTIPPTVLSNGANFQAEGTAAISDTSGNLLFYTNGVTVYDNSHAAMPNGQQLTGDQSSTQSALIVPQPGSDSLFLVFTAAQTCATPGFRYSVVDMSLNNGGGDVIPGRKNMPLLTPTPEKIAAVHHCNGEDVWVSTLKSGTSEIYSWLVTEDGLCECPVVSNTGPVHVQSFACMKFSNDGQWMVILEDYQGCGATCRSDLYQFDKQTGEFTFYQNIQIAVPNNSSLGGGFWGASFSPNNQVLYLTSGNSIWRYNGSGGMSQGSAVIQYDLQASNIESSAYIVYDDVPGVYSCWSQMTSMQLAPDGKIYVSTPCPRLDAIQNPDVLGPGCNYTRAVASLSQPAGFGTSNFIESYFSTNNATCNETGAERCALNQSGPCDTIVGLQSDVFIGNDKLEIAPHPVTSTSRITWGEPISGTLRMAIFDLQGRKVWDAQEESSSEFIIDRETFDRGIYLVKIWSAEKVKTARILIE